MSEDSEGERTMLCFTSDYIAGAHPEVLKRLNETNLETLPGYGSDRYCDSAAEKIRAACACPDAEVFFLVGGTQTNQIVIDTMLQPYEGVIAASTGHVNVHEAGAIEFSGHKVLSVESREGKLSADSVAKLCAGFYADGSHEHMVFPGMVYISFPTEYGTLYSLSELEAIAAVCRSYEMPLYIDGARLAYGLSGMGNDVTLPDIARLADVFYIGGTKCGALCGEAVVFTKHNAPKHFTTRMKQHGGLLAKGRVLGIQFDALFSNGLYEQIGAHALSLATRLKAMFAAKGYRLFIDSPTNQQFVILSNDKLAALSSLVACEVWEQYDSEHTVVRFATSWSTTAEELDELDKLL